MKNLLTDDECNVIANLSKLPALNLIGASHSFRYFGVDREANLENIQDIEAILKKWVPDLVSFSNFTGQAPNRIRIQAAYSPMFTGVHYLDLPSNEVPCF
jgi:hypothetical protein